MTGRKRKFDIAFLTGQSEKGLDLETNHQPSNTSVPQLHHNNLTTFTFNSPKNESSEKNTNHHHQLFKWQSDQRLLSPSFLPFRDCVNSRDKRFKLDHDNGDKLSRNNSNQRPNFGKHKPVKNRVCSGRNIKSEETISQGSCAIAKCPQKEGPKEVLQLGLSTENHTYAYNHPMKEGSPHFTNFANSGGEFSLLKGPFVPTSSASLWSSWSTLQPLFGSPFNPLSRANFHLTQSILEQSLSPPSTPSPSSTEWPPGIEGNRALYCNPSQLSPVSIRPNPSPTLLLPPSLSSLNHISAQNVCASCNLAFRMTSDLVYHMRSHHHKTQLSDPIRKQREEKLKCSVCHERFRERHHLTRHMTAHQDREEEKAMMLAGSKIPPVGSTEISL